MKPDLLEKLLKWDSSHKTGDADDAGGCAFPLADEPDTDPSMRNEYIDYRNTTALFALREAPGDAQDGQKAYRAFRQGQRRRVFRKWAGHSARYAAAAIVAAVVCWFVWDNRFGTDALHTNTVTAPWGQRAEIELSDGTVVWLNSGSTLSYPSRSSGKTREVIIDGEGFFSVARDERRPFVVRTRQLDITVLGTQFNVTAYDDNRTVVSLVEGSVEVTPQLAGQEPVVMAMGDRLSYSDGEITLRHGFNSDDLLWKEGVVSFTDQTFTEIARRLEQLYNVHIEIRNPSIGIHRYSGKFRQSDGVMEILDMLGKIHGFRITRDGQQSVIYLD